MRGALTMNEDLVAEVAIASCPMQRIVRILSMVDAPEARRVDLSMMRVRFSEDPYGAPCERIGARDEVGPTRGKEGEKQMCVRGDGREM